MLELPENELFSAYIDGELTADEQAEVEKILNDDPEARQLVDELRSLSHSLQSLPSYKLEENLVERVLRQAEREMLAQPSAPLPRFHQVDLPETKSNSWARRLLCPRNFAWSAVAILVAVFLLFNDRGVDNDAPKVAGNRDGVIIEPLDVVPTVEAVEGPRDPTIAQNADPGDQRDEPKIDVPEVIVPTPDAELPEPTMVADTAPDTNAETAEAPVEPKAEASPLLVLQCRLAEGRVGHVSLAQLLEEAGVTLDDPIAEGSNTVELTLTTSQLRQVVQQLQSDTESFSQFSFLPTPKTAAPRIPSPIGPTRIKPKEATSAEGSDPKNPPKVTLRMQGTITIQPKVAPRVNPAETTSVEGSPKPKVKVPASAIKTPKNLPGKVDRTYRVRFLLQPAEKGAASEGSGEE